jgi:UDP-N-acetylmuramoyl-L-alanyl-D-glutamate--2,6-diaminopimelate ligase
MGHIAERWADHVVITDDNPRNEKGQDIANDIVAGCTTKLEVIQNRKQAIQKVVLGAAKDDCIVIAGKGHEQYQEIKGIRLPFSDRQEVMEALDLRRALKENG